ncbi:MAG: sugar phosphate isomerase/epimerase [Lentisphaeria bacterium]|nr:sugar phosphate isomerase/epimerase [Lentisphaeria bacterium]
MSVAPLTIGVCSWSMQVKSITELESLCDRTGIHAVQIACGDPHHASWTDDDMESAAKAANFTLLSTMIGFPGEDYTTPLTIKQTGGFGDPARNEERLEIFKWAVQRTANLGLDQITSHGGFIPEIGEDGRSAFLDTLGMAAAIAAEKGVTLCLETGQESAELLKATLDELKLDNLKVNFDPANMLMYDMGDPIKAVAILAEHISSVHCKDANAPTTPGDWGEEVPLGEGQVNIKQFIQALIKEGYTGPLVIEREVGNQEERIESIITGKAQIELALAN